MKRLVLPAIVVVALGLSACGAKHDPSGPPGTQPLSLMLDFFPNADHAGIYAAQADGEFRRAGLDVALRVPGDPSQPLKLLAAGKVDLAISYEPELLLARDKGAKLVSIAALVQRPLTSIISLDRGFHSPADVENHTVGTAGIPYQSAYLKTTVQNAGGDPSRVKEVDVGFNLVPAMLSKKVYATLGGFWNYEGIQLARKHRDPTIVRVDQAGVPTYDELVIVARQDEVGPRRRCGASSRPWPAAIRACAPTPRSGCRRCCERRRTSTRICSARRSAPRCRRSSRPAPASRGAGRTRRSGRPTAAGCTPTGCSSSHRSHSGR
jgi:putative hydroxymethylpyrimidine transport system substrate-binding protein